MSQEPSALRVRLISFILGLVTASGLFVLALLWFVLRPSLVNSTNSHSTPALVGASVVIVTSTPTAVPTVIPSATGEPVREPTKTSIPTRTLTPQDKPVQSLPSPTVLIKQDSTATPRVETSTPQVQHTPTSLPTSTPLVWLTRTGDLNAALVGQSVSIEGRIVQAMTFSSGIQIYVDDSSGPALVWIPSEIVPVLLEGVQLALDSTIHVSGVVQEYKDQLEIIPELFDDLFIVIPSMSRTVIPISELVSHALGEIVVTRGQIVTVSPFSQGIKCTLEEKESRIILLLWQSVYDMVLDNQLIAEGQIVTVVGKLEEYKGELEIVPGLGGDVTFE